MWWSNGRPDLDFSFVVEHADPLVCYADAGKDMILNIYPNPTNGALYIGTPVQGQPVKLFDMIGRRLLSATASDSSVTLDLSPLPQGI